MFLNVSLKSQNGHIKKKCLVNATTFNHGLYTQSKKVTPKPPKKTHDLPSISNLEASKAANNAISSPSSGMLPSRQEAAKAA